MRIRTHVVFMAAAILVPVVLAASIALEQIRQGERQAVLRGLRETVRATALIVDREVQGSLSALNVLGQSAHLRSRNFSAFYGQVALLTPAPDVWTVVYDEQGRQVLNTEVPYGSALAPASAGKIVAEVFATQRPVVTGLLREPATGKLRTNIYAPVNSGGGSTLAVSQAFGLAHWKSTALQARLPADWVVAVIDREGRFIARSHKSDELLGTQARPELVAAAAAADEGLIRHATLEGVESYDAFAHSALTGWTVAVAAPVVTVEAAARGAIQLALTGILGGITFALLAAAAFGRRFIQAIERAGRAAVSLGRGEKPVVERTAIDEVDVLNRHLREAGALLDLERHSRQAAEAERERLLAGETLAREDAQAQNVAKDNFLAMLGHELRNPLAAIAGATSLLEMESASRGGAGPNLQIIRRQSRHLGHIVNDLLDISRLMAGKIMLERGPLRLANCVRHSVEAIRATDLAVGYHIELQSDDVWVDGDGVRLEQIVTNLVTNALKFSATGSVVEVSVRREADCAVVAVRDHGVGMSAEMLVRAFEPFVQGPAPQDSLQSGLGIGLALARQLVNMHGGTLEAASAGAGKGSTLTFWLPAIDAPADDTPSPAVPTEGGHRIVYVEDNKDARQTTAAVLRSFGYEVFEVATGGAALPAVLAAQPDAVLLDVGLPDMSGYDVARGLRADARCASVAIIGLTGYGQERDKEVAALAGFDTHLVKPVDIHELIRTIDGVLARRRAESGVA